MEDVYNQYQDFEIISICIEDLIDTVKYYARMYSFLFLIDGDQSTWAQYYQSGFTPIWYILEPNDSMTVHGWTESFDSTAIRTWIEECIGVEEVPDEKLHSIKIGPNPTEGLITISAQEPFTVEAYDVVGSLIGQHASHKGRLIWDGRSLPEGVYFLRIRSGSVSGVSKIAIVR